MTDLTPTAQASTPAHNDCAIVELRQYTLRPQQREVLVELFDREFVESQEALGMAVMGQFRDLDQPELYVWLRGFADMASRQQALQAFYGGPVWAAHGPAANATMVDSDNVLLLRPAWPGAGLRSTLAGRAAAGTAGTPGGLLDATVFYLKDEAGPQLLELARGLMSDVLRSAGADVLGWYVTEPAENSFPRLPVRTGEPVLVGLAMFQDAAAFNAFAASGAWGREVAPLLDGFLARPPESHRLAPTPRSAIHA
jgi:hypothetical protein